MNYDNLLGWAAEKDRFGDKTGMYHLVAHEDGEAGSACGIRPYMLGDLEFGTMTDPARNPGYRCPTCCHALATSLREYVHEHGKAPPGLLITMGNSPRLA